MRAILNAKQRHLRGKPSTPSEVAHVGFELACIDNDVAIEFFSERSEGPGVGLGE